MMVPQCRLYNSPIWCKWVLYVQKYAVMKTFLFYFVLVVWTQTAAGRLLKHYQEVSDDISLCLLTSFILFPVPNPVLLWPLVVFYYFFNASPFVPYFCVYHHTVCWWGLIQAGCVVLRIYFHWMTWLVKGPCIMVMIMWLPKGLMIWGEIVITDLQKSSVGVSSGELNRPVTVNSQHIFSSTVSRKQFLYHMFSKKV